MAKMGIPAWLDEATARRVDALKLVPRESRRDVIARLLDSYDLSHPKHSAGAASDHPAEVPA